MNTTDKNTENKVMKLILKTFVVAQTVAIMGGCVSQRPERNGLLDESQYLDKSKLTGDTWLYKTTVIKASTPNVLGDLAFPGLESDTALVNFRFSENSLQILDARALTEDRPEDVNDNLTTRTERVIFEIPGKNVDIKHQETLDGELTNLLEENTEAPWDERQHFKAEFEQITRDPVANIAWYYGDFVHDCTTPISTSLVPESYEETDDYLSFMLEVNYALTVEGYCWDLVSMTYDAGTVSVQYRFSFLKRDPNTGFVSQIIDEKDPVNKKYGSFQTLNVFRDHETGILSGSKLLNRWNPARTDPVVFYFQEGFPEKFKPMFQVIKDGTNAVLQEAGAALRFDFRDWNDGGVERKFGDLRYSFVVWNQDIDTTRGLLGYGPSSADPRTGEIISANLNLYNIGMDYYRFLIESFLQENGGAPTDGSCPPGGGRAAVADRLQTALFNSMRDVMNLPEGITYPNPAEEFLPQPARQQFGEDYHRLLPELRYVEPLWNEYVWSRQAGRTLTGFRERLVKESEFMGSMNDILMNGDPVGVAQGGAQGIEAQLEFIDQMRDWRHNHEMAKRDRELLFSTRNIYEFNFADAISAINESARKCAGPLGGAWESDEAYTERIIESVVFHVAIHEFGHNLSLRHNFYGSVDAKHMEDGELSASVMDYVKAYEEAGSPDQWGAYDKAALKWIYGNQTVRDEMMQEDFLYCTDEHRSRSPLCYAHDLGVTPSQIVLNAIERYDWLYSIRNRRSYRTFWDTYGYVDGIYSDVFDIQRMWYLGLYDWSGGGVQDTLKRLDLVGGNPVLSDPEYDEIAADFWNEVVSANALIMAFYDSIINQSAAFRNYQTEFDPYYGDVLRLGIIIDKLFATFAFMDLQYVWNYDPNVADYVAMYDVPLGTRNQALATRVLDNMLGSSYDTFPWFKYTAIAIFADATNTNLVGNVSLKDRIAIKRYNNLEDMEAEFGDVLSQTELADNPAQYFVYGGEQYVYTYIADRGWHLVASAARNPVSFQFMDEYNRALNSNASDTLDTYELKVLLAYYEYFNNFVGY